MATTNLIVELVVVGTGAAIWIVLVVLTVFGYSWISFDRLVDLMTAPVLLPALSITYILGIVLDRLADTVFHPCSERIRRNFYPTDKDYQSARTTLRTSSEALTELFEYGRSRIRVCRGWAVNSVLIGIALNLFIWIRLPAEAPRARLSAFGTISTAAILLGTVISWRELTRTEYGRVSEQSKHLEDNGASDNA